MTYFYIVFLLFFIEIADEYIYNIFINILTICICICICLFIILWIIYILIKNIFCINTELIINIYIYICIYLYQQYIYIYLLYKLNILLKNIGYYLLICF